MSKTLEPGYFWVKWDGDWFISKHEPDGTWWIPGIISHFSVYDFDEIDERPIVREKKELPGVPVE